MKIVADQNIPGLEGTFGRHGEVEKVDGRTLQRGQLQDADALIVRSVTRVGRALLHDTPVAFVGTATIGTDHLDHTWLEETGVRWAGAPGCNADAAAQYSLSMIMLACKRAGIALSTRRCGIIGCGNVGSRLQAMLTRLGVDTLACDPPLAEAGERGLVPLDEIKHCNLISLHVPLTVSGRHPTFQMVDRPLLERLPADTLIVNAARGDVVSQAALLNWLQRDKGHAALDVWPGEPDPDEALIRGALVATPHVAGYSSDGKRRGAEMVYQAFVKWMDGKPDGSLPESLPRGENLLPHCSDLAECLDAACGTARDDAALRSILRLARMERARAFDHLRSEYPPRRDFAGWRLPASMPPNLRETLIGLGFTGPP